MKTEVVNVKQNAAQMSTVRYFAEKIKKSDVIHCYRMVKLVKMMGLAPVRMSVVLMMIVK